ncbi:hypothetical protein ACFU6S_32640 [Streptomyces sp. NPDC057456]|uniref:hypothetical protein n=1 Tax=Streptomyces sp. NPDC057456 TaxID=3346139 RepID=UPI00368CA0CC
METPQPLTADERARLAKYEDTPDADKSRDDVIDELALRTKREAHDKYRGHVLIRAALSEVAEAAPRGTFTKVVEASPYKREYVARIRDGVVNPYGL